MLKNFSKHLLTWIKLIFKIITVAITKHNLKLLENQIKCQEFILLLIIYKNITIQIMIL